MLAFRARYYVGVLTYLFNVAVYYFIWRAVFHSGTTVSGLTLPDMVTYVAVGWAIRSRPSWSRGSPRRSARS